MLLYLLLLSNSFVTGIGCCSLPLLYLRLLFIIDFIEYLCFPTPGPSSGPGPYLVFTGPGSQFVFACFLQLNFVIVKCLLI